MALLVEGLTGDQTVAGLSLIAGGASHFIRCLLLVQPWKISPNMTEKLLTGM